MKITKRQFLCTRMSRKQQCLVLSRRDFCVDAKEKSNRESWKPSGVEITTTSDTFSMVDTQNTINSRTKRRDWKKSVFEGCFFCWTVWVSQNALGMLVSVLRIIIHITCSSKRQEGPNFLSGMVWGKLIKTPVWPVWVPKKQHLSNCPSHSTMSQECLQRFSSDQCRSFISSVRVSRAGWNYFIRLWMELLTRGRSPRSNDQVNENISLCEAVKIRLGLLEGC